jgi:hypothetical protein
MAFFIIVRLLQLFLQCLVCIIWSQSLFLWNILCGFLTGRLLQLFLRCVVCIIWSQSLFLWNILCGFLTGSFMSELYLGGFRILGGSSVGFSCSDLKLLCLLCCCLRCLKNISASSHISYSFCTHLFSHHI